MWAALNEYMPSLLHNGTSAAIGAVLLLRTGMRLANTRWSRTAPAAGCEVISQQCAMRDADSPFAQRRPYPLTVHGTIPALPTCVLERDVQAAIPLCEKGPLMLAVLAPEPWE